MNSNADAALARVIAIDGPAGSGKSTVARAVAGALGLEMLDTGAMYRAVTFAVLAGGIDPGAADDVAAIAESIEMVIGPPTMVNGADATTAIRGPDVTANVSEVSAHPAVRRALVARQREWIAAHDGGVVEGRDIGTVVAPTARLKVFLVASDDERARRRQRDEVSARRDADLDDLRSSIARRDRLDSTRESSPLRAAADALLLDTTGRTVDDVVAEVIDRYQAVVRERT